MMTRPPQQRFRLLGGIFCLVFIYWLRDLGLAEFVDDAEVMAKHGLDRNLAKCCQCQLCPDLHDGCVRRFCKNYVLPKLPQCIEATFFHYPSKAGISARCVASDCGINLLRALLGVHSRSGIHQRRVVLGQRSGGCEVAEVVDNMHVGRRIADPKRLSPP